MILDLQAKDRWQAIDELIQGLIDNKQIAATSRDAITAAIKKRELSMTTGIGYGIALPHASTDLVSEIVYILGRSKQGINFDPLDGKPVHRVVLFLVPIKQFPKNLHALTEMVKLAHKIEL